MAATVWGWSVAKGVACAALVALTAGATLPEGMPARGGDPGGMRGEPAGVEATWPAARRVVDLPVQLLGELQRRGELGGRRVRRGAQGVPLGASVQGLGASASLGASVQGIGASVPLGASVQGLGASVLPPGLSIDRDLRSAWAPSALAAAPALDGWWSWTRARSDGGYWSGSGTPETPPRLLGAPLLAFLSSTDFAAPRR